MWYGNEGFLVIEPHHEKVPPVRVNFIKYHHIYGELISTHQYPFLATCLFNCNDDVSGTVIIIFVIDMVSQSGISISPFLFFVEGIGGMDVLTLTFFIQNNVILSVPRAFLFAIFNMMVLNMSFVIT